MVTQRFKYVFLSLMIALAFLSVVQAYRNAAIREGGSQDFQWGASRDLLHGHDPYKIYMQNQRTPGYIVNNNYFTSPDYLPCYPPSCMMMLWPWAAMSLNGAKVAWALGNFAFSIIIIICSLKLIGDKLSRTSITLFTCLFLISTPFRNLIGNGQHTLLSFSFFLLSVVWSKKNSLLSGLSLTAGWFKYTVTFPLTLIYVKKGQYLKILVIGVITHTILTLLLAFHCNENMFELLFGHLKMGIGNYGLGHLDMYRVARFLGFMNSKVPYFVAGALLIVATYCIRKEDDVLSSLSLMCFISMVVLHHMGYDYVVLVVPLAYVFRDRFASYKSMYYSIAILLVWYVDKLFYIGQNIESISKYTWIFTGFFTIKAIAYYAVILLDLYDFTHEHCFARRENFVARRLSRAFQNHKASGDSEAQSGAELISLTGEREKEPVSR